MTKGHSGKRLKVMGRDATGNEGSNIRRSKVIQGFEGQGE